MMFPLVTNCCFAIELLLKTLIAAENANRFPDDHSLFRLFQELAPATKAEIEAGWKEHCESVQMVRMRDFYAAEQGVAPDLRLSTGLKEAGDGFVRFRYAFERSRKPLPAFMLSGLERVVMDVILRRYPHFASVHPRVG